MADNAQTLARLIVEVGAKGFTDVDKEIKSTEASLAKLRAEFQSNAIGISQYTQEGAKLQSRLAELKAGAKEAAAAVKQYGSEQKAAAALSKQAESGFKGMSGAGVMGLMALSNAIDDVQYGFRGIVNNIPMMITGLGSLLGKSAEASMAAGAIGQIIAVAINVALPHIQKLAKEYGLLGSEVDKATGLIDKLHARIKEIEEKPIKLAVDVHELEELKKQMEEFQHGIRAYKNQLAEKTKPQAEASQAMGSLIEATGRGDEIRKKMVQDYVQQKHAQIQAEFDTKEKMAKEGTDETPGDMAINALGDMLVTNGVAPLTGRGKVVTDYRRQQKLKSVKDARDLAMLKAKQEADSEVGILFEKGTSGKNRGEQMALGKHLRDIGEHGLAQAIEESTPEEMKKRDQAKIQQEHQAKISAEYEKKAEKYAADFKDTIGAAEVRKPAESVAEWGKLFLDIRARLKAAGVSADDIEKTFESTAMKIKEGAKADVRDYMLAHNVDEKTARERVATKREEAAAAPARAEAARKESAQAWRSRKHGSNAIAEAEDEIAQEQRVRNVQTYGAHGAAAMDFWRDFKPTAAQQAMGTTEAAAGQYAQEKAKANDEAEAELQERASGNRVKAIQDGIADAIEKKDKAKETKLRAELPKAEKERDEAGKVLAERGKAQWELQNKRYTATFSSLPDFAKTLQLNALNGNDDGKRTAVATEQAADSLKRIDAKLDREQGQEPPRPPEPE